MSASDFVHLGRGLIVPLQALLAVLDIERAGHTLSLDGDDVLVERGRGMAPLDPTAIDALRKWKAHAWLIVRHCTSDRPARGRTMATRKGTAPPRDARTA